MPVYKERRRQGSRPDNPVPAVGRQFTPQSQGTQDALRASEQSAGMLDNIDRDLDELAENRTDLPWQDDTRTKKPSVPEPDDEDGDTTPPAKDDLKDREENPEDNRKKTEKPQGKQKGKGKGRGKRKAGKALKRWLVGALISILVTAIGGVLTILPNKLDLMTAQMEAKFYARVQQYVEKRSANMFFRYLAVYVFNDKAAIETCKKAGQTSFAITHECFHREDESQLPLTKLGQMYALWREVRLEKRLAPLEIIYNPDFNFGDRIGPAWTITFPDKELVAVDPDNTETALKTVFIGEGRRAAYRQFMDILKQNTNSNFITRALAARHFENKYGGRPCIFYCDKRDRLDNKLDFKKAWRGFLADRIVGSVNMRAGLFLECAFQGGRSCSEDNPEFRAKTEAKVRELRARFGEASIDSMLKVAEEFGVYHSKGGSLSRFMINKINEKIGNRLAIVFGSQVLNTIPIIGSVIAGVLTAREVVAVVVSIGNLFSFVKGKGIQYASTVIKAAAFVAAYATLKTGADETRGASTVFDIQARGAETESLDGIERSFLWNSQFGNKPAFSNFGAFFAKQAYAAEPTQEYPYDCNDDGKMDPPEANEVLCPNWRFDTPSNASKYTKDIPSFGITSEAGQEVLAIATEVNDTIDAPMNAVSDAAYEQLPTGVKDWIDTNMGEFTNVMVKEVFAPPFEDAEDISRAKLYDASYVGVDWLINDQLRGGIESSGQMFGYGARLMTDQEIHQQTTAIEQEQQEKFERLGFWEKLTSAEYSQSFASQLALAAPSNLGQTLAVMNPATYFNLLGGAISPAKAVDITRSPAHIPQYGFGDEINSPVRDERDTAPCPIDRGENGIIKGLGDPGTADRGLGRAEITTANICQLDDLIASEHNSAIFSNRPIGREDSDASFTSSPAGTIGQSTGVLAWPIKEDDFREDTSCYGPRDGGFHHGLDMTGLAGDGKTLILAADGGTVVSVVKGDDSAGNYVAIEHAAKRFTMYLHMYPDIRVAVGDKVAKGQVLGREGNFGHSTGPHLHFNVTIDQPRGRDPFSRNPMNYLPLIAGTRYTANTSCRPTGSP